MTVPQDRLDVWARRGAGAVVPLNLTPRCARSGACQAIVNLPIR